jgi:hypothetical protein
MAAFLWLSEALRNHSLPSSSTSRTFIGRVAQVAPPASKVEKKQVCAFLTTSFSLSTACLPARSWWFFSGWFWLIESM